MKYIFTILFTMFLAISANAETYCQWDGAVAQNCRETVTLPSGQLQVTLANGARIIATEAIANSKGYYLVERTFPPYDDATQKLVGPTQTFSNNRIQQIWSVEAKTATELNEYKSQAMSVEMYQVLKWLKTPGAVICDGADTAQCHIQPSTAPASIKDAFLARQALGQ